MDKSLIETTLKEVKGNSPKKNFKQSIDLVINLKGLDLKKTEHQVNSFLTLHNDTGKKISVCAFVDSDMETKTKDVCDETILVDNFGRYKGKAEMKKLANKHDFFIAQASVMSKVATAFGRFLGPQGKMPNPKIGSVLPPNANVKQVYDRLKKTISLATKNEPTIKCRVGYEDTNDTEVIDNILTIYNSVIQKLPNDQHNVKSIILKLTMGPAFVVGKKAEEKGKKAKAKPEEPKAEEKPKEQTKREEKKKVAKH
tara:strand:- start:2317 stop:3081 length:765 start_codon:yes stop_codon:yes gene_type:complete